MKNKHALALVLAAVAIGTVAIAQQPQRLVNVGGDSASDVPYSPLDTARFRVGLIDDPLVAGQEAGVLVEINVKEGDMVKAHQPLAKIDDSQPRMQGKIAHAEFKAAEEKANSTVDIEYATKASEVALKEFQKSREANKKQPGTVSATEVERQWLTYERGILEIKRANSEKLIAGLTANAKEVEIEAAVEAVKRRVITSPVDGMVVQIFLQKGEWVKPGDPVVHVMQFDKLRVEGSIELAKFSPSEIIDSPVTVEATLQNRKLKFDGRIVFVKPVVNTIGEYQIKAEVENRREKGSGLWLLLPGMYVDMTIHPRK
jgi:multidrug efflux pump subunit AcrA (membrane-fusion protein)